MKKTFFFSLLVLLMTACNFSSTITVLPGTKELPKEGGEFTITVTTDNDQREWIAECDSAWIHLDKTAGIGGDKVEVTVDANPYATTQSATIHFRCESNSVHVIVLRAGTGSSSSEGKPSQNPNAPIQVDVTEIEAPAEGIDYETKPDTTLEELWTMVTGLQATERMDTEPIGDQILSIHAVNTNEMETTLVITEYDVNNYLAVIDDGITVTVPADKVDQIIRTVRSL